MRTDNDELKFMIKEFTTKELVNAISENERLAEEGHPIYGGSFDGEILYGEEALFVLSQDLYLKELNSRS